MSALAAPFTFANGSTIKNRYMLAALTNLQSGADGVLSDCLLYTSDAADDQ